MIPVRLLRMVAPSFLLVWAATSVGHAQLADTIWEGNLPISNLTWQQIKDGVMQPPALEGGKMTVPVEIWFWNDGSAWLMFHNQRWGWTRGPKTQPWLPRSPGSARWENTVSYSWNARTRKGSVQGRSLRLVDSSYHYNGYFLSWSGSFAVQGSRMTVTRMTLAADSKVVALASSADPRNAPTGISFSRYPTFGPSLVLNKVVGRAPSTEIPGIDYD